MPKKKTKKKKDLVLRKLDAYPPVNDQIDAVLDWAVTVRMARGDFEKAETVEELKKALKPVFNLPQDLDDILGQVAAVKRMK